MITLYLDKHIFIQLNGNRKITGVLRGFDPFMNLVVDETMEIVSATEKNSIGTVVLRGNSVILVESLEKI
ncbi:like-Sm ribonucleo protein [Anaeromyces robustus]|uniref:Small nuclear ribonucleoprotein G n=1 Tax=Anaeromyces robustus TaxID=1754192 RepID=A0A1Y1U9E6_9FUNG|nr:like-Sm ribonucleo protein [Anaeromyces robustus]|eukprot:ORX33715.1 like-Sm ribonucleo protein [Anaeromyces robustus]